MAPKQAKSGLGKPPITPGINPPAQATPAKKKKRNDPLRPQPAWLFPPDDENPILNPKNKSKEEIQQEIDERLAAIRFLEHKSVTAPVKTAPPSELLQLVASFLASYGFVSTGRIFSLERNARRKLDGWNDQIGEKKFAKNQPNLVTIFKEWRADWKRDSDDDTSSSGEDSEQDVAMKDADSSSSDSDDDSSDDSEKESKAAKTKTKSNGVTLQTTLREPAKKETTSKDTKTTSPSTSESESESESDSESDAEEVTTVTKTVIKTSSIKPQKPSQAASDSESSSESSSASDSSSEDESESANTISKTNSITTSQISKPIAVTQTAASDSSETLKGDSPAKELSTSVSSSSASSSASSSSSESESDSDAATKPKQSKSSTKRKADASDTPIIQPGVQSNKKAKTTKESFSRIPKDIQIDPRLSSNKYVSYDYADKAHRDLIVTKGKGFTKEKNKKKRGAYRGGRIDTDGGKGVKFDD